MFNRVCAKRFFSSGWLLVVTLLAGAHSPAFAYNKEIRSLAGQITLKVTSAQKGRIAVVDFADLQGNVNELGRFLADQLSAELSESSTAFQVIDRGNLAAIMRENRLSASSLFDVQTTRQLGKLSGVNAIVTGSITPFLDTVHITIKVIDTDTAKMIGSSGEDIARNDAIDALLKQTVGGTQGAAAPGYGGKTNNRAYPIVAEQNKFTFELQACELSGENISCNLLVKNSAKSRTLSIKSSTMLFDDQGNQYFPNAGQIANSREVFDNRCCDQVSMPLVTEVPASVSVSFQGIAPQASKVSMLTLDCNDSDNVRFQVSFRNVSIEQKAVAGIDRSLVSTTMGFQGNQANGAQAPAEPTVKGMTKSIVKRGFGKLLERGLEVFDQKLKEQVDRVLPPPNQN